MKNSIKMAAILLASPLALQRWARSQTAPLQALRVTRRLPPTAACKSLARALAQVSSTLTSTSIRRSRMLARARQPIAWL